METEGKEKLKILKEFCSRFNKMITPFFYPCFSGGSCNPYDLQAILDLYYGVKSSWLTWLAW